MRAICAGCGKRAGKVRGHYSKYVFDFPDGVEKYEPDNMEDWCTCLCVDGATLEQRRVIHALKTRLGEATPLLKAAQVAACNSRSHGLEGAIKNFFDKHKEDA